MQLENEFSVPVPVEQAWAALLDVERVAPCMPGATLTSFDGETFTGNVKVKLGPVSLTYGGQGRFVSRDDAAHTVEIEASGKDSRGRGTAGAKVSASLEPSGTGTLVKVVTDLKVTGPPAQFGRGMIGDVSKRLIDQFATCLASKLAEPSAESPDKVPVAADSAAPAEIPAVTPAVTPAVIPAPEPASVEPIDLMAVTGASAKLRKAMPYVVAFLAGAVVGAVIMAALR